MHIEPGVVSGAKIVLSYGTAAASSSVAARMAVKAVKETGLFPIAIKSAITSVLVFSFFEILPHPSVGVSEVHLIAGSTLFLLFGAVPSAIGLALGLLLQGLLFAPLDLPQYGMNLTTLLVPLFTMASLAKRIIPDTIAYHEIRYTQALKLSTTYQGGIVAWVAFWALYGNGFESANLLQIVSFGTAYMSVIIIEPVLDLTVLACAKLLHGLKGSPFVEKRLYAPAA